MDTGNLAAASKLLPRAYQEEIFAHAQRTNIIAALDTGSGKTFIGALLIKWAAAQAAQNGKKVVFLVPKVPLVEQQRSFLAEQTPLKVKGYWGSMGVDTWDRVMWRREFTQSDVLVMTAQIFYNILAHAFWRIDQVSLLVLDESHHAQKNHPYNMIMAEHYANCIEEHRPKVFGMTASPIWNLKKPQESLQQLEHNLFAKVLAVRDHTEELLTHAPKPTEIVRQYPSPPLAYPDYLSPSLWERLESTRLLHMYDDDVEQLRGRYWTTLQALGPYAADCFLHSHITHKLGNALQNEYILYLKMTTMAAFVPAAPAWVNGETSDAMHADGHPSPAAQAKLQQELALFEPHLSTNTQLADTWVSPKFLAVVEILTERRSDTFQGILFVEQRQIATTLAALLSRVTHLKKWLRCADLTGHGHGMKSKSGKNTSVAKGMGMKRQQDVVKAFREGKLNFLIATSVAEEGLDFPVSARDSAFAAKDIDADFVIVCKACELVIRFDALHHMVGYVQSRGRARHHTSTFVVMIEENDAIELARYRRYKESEPELRLIYQGVEGGEGFDTEDREHDNPDDLAERETFVVPSTGAMLSYASAISMLNHLCALIPRDKYTPMHRPTYDGDVEVTVQLPSALPLPREHLTYVGPPKRTKKEAKRAAAYTAVKELYHAGVFDDYLAPSKPTSGEGVEDADGHAVPKVSEVPEIMDVWVRDPWRAGPEWWLHIVSLDGRRCTGLVTGTQLPPLDLVAGGVGVGLSGAMPIAFDADEKAAQIELMERFTKMGLWFCVTGTPIDAPLTCFLVPLDVERDQPDWETMERAVYNKYGTYDWEGIDKSYSGHLLVAFNEMYGRPYVLRRIRDDLTPQSPPPSEFCEGDFSTYADFFMSKYARKRYRPKQKPLVVPTHGHLLELSPLPRRTSSIYIPPSLPGIKPKHDPPPAPVLVPQIFCKWVYLLDDVYRCFHVLSALCHRITDVYRARCARRELHLPPVSDDLLIEAFTLPCADAGFNNQRLETLGDAVLKLGVVVYLFNRYPNKHEGQLDCLKKNCVSNRTLLARARERKLEQYLTGETQAATLWRYVADDGVGRVEGALFAVRRQVARRSLQDCMEASLGASFLTGGFDLALQMGTALGVCFGGAESWTARYPRLDPSPSSTLTATLQEALGYHFRSGELLVEAVTHPSYESSGGRCYQRLEFLGDALIDMVVTKYLFDKYPRATSGQMSWARSRAVCAPTLAVVAVQRLSLHKYMLANNVELGKAISQQIQLLTTTTYEDIVKSAWRYDPPKAISDLLESTLGAVLVDSGYNYELASRVTEYVMSDILAIVNPQIPRDPVSELVMWAAKSGCCRIAFHKSQSNPIIKRNDSVSVLVHDEVFVGPITAPNLSLAKGLASAETMAILSDPSSDRAIARVCDCAQVRLEASRAAAEELPDVDESELDDETEVGFALTGQIRLRQFGETPAPDAVADVDAALLLEELEDEHQVEALTDIDGYESQEAMDCS